MRKVSIGRGGHVLLLMAAAILFPSQAAAQERPSRPPPGCTGMLYTGESRPVPRTEYPVVTAVGPESPADEAGFRVGDVILSVNGSDARTLPRLFSAPSGTRSLVRVRRGERTHELELTAGWALMALRRDGGAGGSDDVACRPALPGVSE